MGAGTPPAFEPINPPPASVLTGPRRTYEITGDIPGRKGVRFARAQGELGFSKLVAVKSMRSDAAEMIHALVVDEARLRHANIVSTLDVLVDSARAKVHVIMEHVDGASLAEVFRTQASSGRRLPPAVAATMLHDVLLGLEHAHGAHDETMGLANMLHCDLSPENVIIGTDGLTRVMDLGLPRLPRSSGGDELPPEGGPAYLAPEQREGRAVDRTADVYVCGALLWELLTGARLYEGVRAPLDASGSLRPSSLARGIPRALDAVVICALSADPRERFQTAGVMARAIREAVRLSARTDVADAMNVLRHGSAEGEPATTVDPMPLGFSTPRSLRSLVERFAGVVARATALAARFPALVTFARGALGKGKELAMQLSFSTRVLLAFSVVSVLILAMLGGRTKSPVPQAATTLTMAAIGPGAPARAVEEPPIELGDTSAPSSSSAAAPPAAAAAAPAPYPVTAPAPRPRAVRASASRVAVAAEPKAKPTVVAHNAAPPAGNGSTSSSSSTAMQLLH